MSQISEEHEQQSDMAPFERGYVEALLADLGPAKRPNGDPDTGEEWEEDDARSFSDLSPEARAMILRDCAAVRALCVPAPYPSTYAGGLAFWWDREDNFAREGWDYLRADLRSCAPPLTITLGDDGKVHLDGAS